MITIFFILLSGVVFGQSEKCGKTTEGTDFWLGFMENRNQTEKRFQKIRITARETTRYWIEGKPYKVTANGSAERSSSDSEVIGSEKIEKKGIHIVSEKPINVYAINLEVNSADAAVIYPTDLLGTDYFAMCYYPTVDPNLQKSNGRNSEFLIVATEDNTTVEITPSKVTAQQKPANITFQVVLNKGETYQVQSENELGAHEQGQGDLTGSYIHSDKPVAFFSGSLATQVGGTGYWDHLYEQIPPVNSWGKEYLTVPLKSREYDTYRIMAAEDNTTVYISGAPVLINRGAFEERVFKYDDPKKIVADKPVLIAQYSRSNGTDSTFTGGDGDPFMNILNSNEQTTNDITFYPFKSPDYTQDNYEGLKKHFVNIITKTSNTGSIVLDKSNIQNEFKVFPDDAEYSYAQVQIEQFTHRLRSLDPNSGFLAYVYGFGGLESYGYSIGFNFNISLDLTEDTVLCYGESLRMDAGAYFHNYEWSNGETSRIITVNTEGTYVVTASNFDCELKDSVMVTVNHPEINLGEDVSDECGISLQKLDAGSGFESYVWQNENGDTLFKEQKYKPKHSGLITITTIDENGCEARDTINLQIYPAPDVQIEGDDLVCGDMETDLSVAISGEPDSLWNFSNNFLWKSNNPAVVAISQTSRTSAHVQVSAPGSFEIYYQLKTIDSCLVTDTFQVQFNPLPSSDFEITYIPDALCKDYSRTVSYTGNAGADASFEWDFGGSLVLNTLGPNSFHVSLGISDSDPVVQLIVGEDGCYSEPTRIKIGSNPLFKMDSEQDRGCDSLTVQFNSELLVPQGLSYEWDFGDESGISNQQNPLHAYSSPGMYDVTLKIINNLTNCEAGFKIDSMIKVVPTPFAKIAADPGFCYPDTTLLFYPNNTGFTLAKWEFEGMHRVGSGNDSVIVVFDEPAATVRLTVDEYGCVSNTAKMSLKRKPNFDFHIENDWGCIPFMAKVEAETSDEMVEFAWITDSLPLPSGTSHTFTFQESGKYDVGLIAHSMQTGCSDTLVKKNWIDVFSSPVASFRADYPIALIDNSTITFTNFSERADYFYWDFGDSTFSEEKNPVHTYHDLGEYVAKLIVTTDNGCIDSTQTIIKIISDKTYAPNAFRPGSPIEENRTFLPVGLDTYQYNFKMKIYNRWGQVVYETNSSDQPWDGNTMDGKPAPGGNYIWIAKYIDVQGLEHQQTGQVLLLR